MKFMKNLIKKWVRESITELLLEEDIKLDISTLKKYRTSGDDNKRKFFRSLEVVEINEIRILITYIDPCSKMTNTHLKRFKDLATFRKYLMNFTPKSNHISGVSLGASVKSDIGDSNLHEHIVSSWKDEIYEAKSLQKFFQPIVEWLDKNPELLV